MGRVALIDSGLEDIITASSRKRPSQSIRDFEDECDVIFLLNQAKTQESGIVFGAMVEQAAGLGKPLIQIDCGGMFVTMLREGSDDKEDELVRKLSSDLQMEILSPPSLDRIHNENGTIRRLISGVLPDEMISINGTVVGKAINSQVEILERDGRIISMKGARPKQHGLEKLSNVDIEKAIIRSGSIRRSADFQFQCTQKRSADCGSHKNGFCNKNNSCKCAVFIDHCAEDSFELAQEADLAVTVGDDTTTVAGDILARLGVPVIGIIDGDLDRIAGKTTMARGSIIVRVKPGCDDVIGRLVRAEIFREKLMVSLNAGDLAKKIKELAGDRLIDIKPF